MASFDDRVKRGDDDIEVFNYANGASARCFKDYDTGKWDVVFVPTLYDSFFADDWPFAEISTLEKIGIGVDIKPVNPARDGFSSDEEYENWLDERERHILVKIKDIFKPQDMSLPSDNPAHFAYKTTQLINDHQLLLLIRDPNTGFLVPKPDHSDVDEVREVIEARRRQYPNEA